MAVLIALLFFFSSFTQVQALSNPLTGSSGLFNYGKTLELSPPFKELLFELRALGLVDYREELTLLEVSELLQKPLGEGGLFRRKGEERWEMDSLHLTSEERKKLTLLLSELGFIEESREIIDHHFSHVVIFGARAERMEYRLLKTLQFFEEEGFIGDQFFLLGSARPLIDEEVQFLENKIVNFPLEEQDAWRDFLFSKPTEGTAALLLWELHAPPELAPLGLLLEAETIPHGSKRPTSNETIEMLLPFVGECATFFSLSEQPYLRLSDLLRIIVLKDKGDLFSKNFHFSYYHPKLVSPEHIEVVLDEVARNTYLTTEIFKSSLRVP